MSRDPVAALVLEALERALPVWSRGVAWMRDKDAEPGPAAAAVRPHANPRGLDLVTEGDLLVDRVIREGLVRLFPGVPLVSEEQAEAEGPPPRDCFVLDPVDGTSNFAAGLDLWAISLARVQDGRPVEGWLMEGPSRVLNHADAHGYTRGGEPGRVSSRPPHMDLLSVALSHQVVPLLLASNRFLGVRCLGSHATSLAWAASGLVGAHVGRGHPWDIAAGYLFLERAGGRVTTLDGGERAFWTRDMAIAGSPQCVDLCLSILAEAAINEG